MEEKKNYYSIIPANVRYDEELTANAKLLYGEITALCNEKGYCWASDTYFTELYKVSKSSIQNWLKILEKKGYITREILYEKGTKKIKQRYIKIGTNPIQENLNTYTKNFEYPIQKILNTPIQKNLVENNININNTFNNKKEKIDKKEKFVKPTLEELQNYINEKNLNVNAEHFIDYYEANGWKVGKNPMKDWKATIRNWHRRNEEFKKPTLPKKEESVPDWFDKEIEAKTPNETSRKEIEEIINSFKVKS